MGWGLLRMHPDWTQYIQAYFLSIIGGHIAVVSLINVIRTIARQPDKSKALDFCIGGTERAVATTLVIMAPGYVAPFIGAWVALKIAANWERLGSTAFARQGTLIALLGNVYSFAVAIAVGVWVNPHALQVWYPTAERFTGPG